MRYLLGLAGPSGFGSKSTGEQVTEGVSLSCDLTAIITGATSGIGAETARVLAKRGVRLVIPARDRKRAVEVKKMILRESPRAEIILMEWRWTSLHLIQYKPSVLSSYPLELPLNILINNAGTYKHRLELSDDKFEMTFATNYLGHYLLTVFLLEKMVQTASTAGIEGRIINVSSLMHSMVRREGFQFRHVLNPKLYIGPCAYAKSKLANILHAKEIARQLRERKVKVTANAVHPGVVKTGIIRDYNGLITGLICYLASKLLKSTSQGASTTCYAALSSQMIGVTGRYLGDCNDSRCSSLAEDEKRHESFGKKHMH